MFCLPGCGALNDADAVCAKRLTSHSCCTPNSRHQKNTGRPMSWQICLGFGRPAFSAVLVSDRGRSRFASLVASLT